MNLVGRSPVGYFGAVSTPEKLIVQKQHDIVCPMPRKLYLDKLFKDPELEPLTNARLRFKLRVSPDVEVPDYRHVIIQLHDSVDFNRVPAASYQLATESFLISGRIGKAEYVTPNLEVSTYFIFSFIDNNGNELFDEGEAFGTYIEGGDHKVVTVVEDRLSNIEMIIKVNEN